LCVASCVWLYGRGEREREREERERREREKFIDNKIDG
jgi:hypothetical protein